MVKEPLPLLQLGMAIMLDKPIVLLVRRGAKVPNHLKKIAMSIEYIKDDSQKEIERATIAILNDTQSVP